MRSVRATRQQVWLLSGMHAKEPFPPFTYKPCADQQQRAVHLMSPGVSQELSHVKKQPSALPPAQHPGHACSPGHQGCPSHTILRFLAGLLDDGVREASTGWRIRRAASFLTSAAHFPFPNLRFCTCEKRKLV